MKSYLTTHLTVALHAFVITLLVAVSAWYIDNAQNEIEQKLTSRIDETLVHIVNLAETTDRNGADELTERIITDCPRRTEFETLLNGLNSATRRDLLSAQQLFESCGSYHAERKALMVAQLERESLMLSDDLALLAVIRDLTPREINLKTWNELIVLEKERSAFLTEQTDIQSEIISLLIEDSNTTRIQELVRQAQNVNQSLSVIDTQIDALRSKLTS
jgi:hypothetical protein